MLGKSGDIFVITTGRVLLHFIRDPLHHPAMHRSLPAPPTKIYSTQTSAVPRLRSCSRERETPHPGAVGMIQFCPSHLLFFFFTIIFLWSMLIPWASLLPWNAWDTGAKILQSYVLENVVELGRSELNPRLMLTVGGGFGGKWLNLSASIKKKNLKQ